MACLMELVGTFTTIFLLFKSVAMFLGHLRAEETLRVVEILLHKTVRTECYIE